MKRFCVLRKKKYYKQDLPCILNDIDCPIRHCNIINGFKEFTDKYANRIDTSKLEME